MIIKEKIIDEIQKMDVSKLSIIYDNIIKLKEIESQIPAQSESVKSIEEIHKMLSGLDGDWSLDIINERGERI